MLIRILASTVLIFLLQACSSLDFSRTGSPAVTAPPQLEITDSTGWHSVAFYIDWPEGQAPAWHVDAFLANAICRDTLNSYGDDLALWRFHRRATRDKSGHQFSFKFYGNQALARAVYSEIDNHPQTKRLLKSGIVTNIKSSPLQDNPLPQIGDTSDPGWSPALRESWPYFALGASLSWLALIDQLVQAESPAPDSESLRAQLDFYKSINNQVSQLWRHEGGHAYLHHLNALFGYEEIIVKERRTTRF